MSFGFLGIQMGFALQNANASRILQTFGADVEHLSLFWLVAPVTGMIVQPIIGHYSDRTWTRLGRRRPYFLVGGLLAATGLILLPNASLFVAFLPALWIGAGFLMLMDASFNIAMEPFRALVGDLLPNSQRTLGFSIQTGLIGIGAVLGSWLPYVLGEWLGISSTADPGIIPTNVVVSFFVGAAVLLGTILWTVFTTKEHPPSPPPQSIAPKTNGFTSIFRDFCHMPNTMRQLGLVQFFSWFGLFSMWVFTTPALAQHSWGLDPADTSSAAFNEAGNYVGIIFGVYNFVAAVFAFLLPTIANRIGRKRTHALCLSLGGIGLISMLLITDPNHRWLLNICMVGVGIAWASILAMPYAMLAGSIPPAKMGVYMGIFNFFITAPQIVNGLIGGYIVKNFYEGEAIYALVGAGVLFLLAAASVLFVEEKEPWSTRIKWPSSS
ncbi:putative maltose transporter MalT [Lunatimonas lonarensis]|uniref:Putative maltose transporter MalT n=2 Tax=Lunatimonas lonarensis TaxID=1232681 RepID=R7ZN26_9BACT|nr:putative maltose transporter MalT [Lunatimonas lonarensis]